MNESNVIMPIPNGDFEQGEAEWNSAKDRGDCVVTTEQVPDRRHALRIVADRPRNGAKVEGPMVPCQGPGVVELCGKVRACSGRQLGLWIREYDVLNPHRDDAPQSMAALLTGAVKQARTNPCFGDDHPVMAYKTVRFGIPSRQFPGEVPVNAHKLPAEHPEPIWTKPEKTRFEWRWHFAASLVDLEDVLASQKDFEYEVQALRLGDLAILALPGEPFVHAQLEMKQRSAAKRTFVAHMSNRHVGYILTREAIRRGKRPPPQEGPGWRRKRWR
jgi:hypothetical protein